MADFVRMLRGILERSGYRVPGKKHPTGKTMTIKHNSHDDRTTAQLEGAKFSGIRANDMWNRFEIWVYGRIDATLTYQQFWLKPDSLNLLYCQCFGLEQAAFDAATQREIGRIDQRKKELGEFSSSEIDRLASIAEKQNKGQA